MSGLMVYYTRKQEERSDRPPNTRKAIGWYGWLTLRGSSANPLNRMGNQARANYGEGQSWGVAVGILSIEDCGERGNP